MDLPNKDAKQYLGKKHTQMSQKHLGKKMNKKIALHNMSHDKPKQPTRKELIENLAKN